MKENKEKKMTKNQKTSIIVLLLLLITVISATYAYFTAQRGSGGSAEINVEAGTTDSLTFDNGDAITIDANSDNFAKGKGNRDGETEVRAHLVANNTNNTATEQYYVYLNIEKNPFVYTSSGTPELVLQVIDPDGNEVESIDGLTPVTIESTEEDGSQIKGFDITTTSGLVAIKKMHPISANPNEMEPEKNGKTDHTWKIKVILVNLDQDQQVNTGKTFKAQAIVSHTTIPDVDLTTNEVGDTGLKVMATINDYVGNINSVAFQIEGDAEWHQGALEPIQGLDLETSPVYSYTFESLEPDKKYEIETKVTYENNPELLNSFNVKISDSYTLADVCETGGNLNTCLEKLNNYASTKTNLYHHTAELDNSAQDGSYRYAGSNPNNFVCFGEGSENYNQGKDATCPDTNLYRIIGLFGNQVKLIKSEYLTGDELGIADQGKPDSRKENEGLKRVKGDVLNLNGFAWSGVINTNSNNWEESELYKKLNGDDGYWSKLGADWQSKIANVNWNVGGHTEYEITPKAMYDAESLTTKTVTANVGLMYVSDYAYATIPEIWSKKLSEYNNTGCSNWENNWLYNAVYEWTITPYTNTDGAGTVHAYSINYSGSIFPINTGHLMYTLGVRPVFYLNDTVQLNTTGTDGSVLKPFKIA